MSGLLDRFHLTDTDGNISATVIPTTQNSFNIIGCKGYPTEWNATRDKLNAYMSRLGLTSNEVAQGQADIFEYLQ